MIVEHFFRSPGLPKSWRKALVDTVAKRVSPDVRDIHTEFCFNILLKDGLSEPRAEILRWLLAETFQPEAFGASSFLQPNQGQIFEVGPRLRFSTAWSTNEPPTPPRDSGTDRPSTPSSEPSRAHTFESNGGSDSI